MGMPLSVLAEWMSGQEFLEHYKDYLRQPWGPERDELHAAGVAHTVACMAGRVMPEPPSLKDFLFHSRPAPAEPDPEEFARRHGH